MFVKKYHQFKCSLHSPDSRDVYWRGDYFEEYEENNYGYVHGREEFIVKIKGEVCEATFSYFPELKPKESVLRPRLEKAIEEDCAHWLYEHLFDLILGFYENKEFKWEEKEWAYKEIRTEEEMEQETLDFIKKCNVEPENIDFIRSMTYHSAKNQNHYNFYQQVVHKAVLRCVADLFLEIPELSSNIIRYINFTTYRQASMLEFELFEIIAGDTVRPYDE